MLQIKEFAKLCGCTTSILRYYDSKDVLKPFYIETITGYRYYQSIQALEFYRIKQLQEAGLSIKEIKMIKDKTDDEIIDILKEKLIKQQQLVNSIENLINTYQDNKMEIEKNIKKSNESFSMTVKAKDNQLILVKNDEKLSLNFLKKTTEISSLLNNMQKQTLIGFDDFEDLKKYQNKSWNYTKIISGWKTKADLIEKIESTTKPKELCVHLFNINESIDLLTISDIMDAVNSKGYSSNDSLFNVSLSVDDINSYSIIYVE